MFEYVSESKKRFSVGLFGCAAILAALFNFACEPSPSMMGNSNTPSHSSEAEQTDNNLTSLERELRDMRAADFQFIYVLKRRDGGVFDKEDKFYLKDNRPAEINRVSATDDEKAFVIGSNYDFPPENMENLRKRFVIENFSKPIAAPSPAANNNNNQARNKQKI